VMMQKVYKKKSDHLSASGGSRILPRGGHGERAEREPKRGSGCSAPSGLQGQSPGGGSGGKARLRGGAKKLKAFCTFL